MITKQCQSQWQTSWDRINSGRATHDLIPLIGHKHLFPRDRCTAISYVRLLLNDSLLKAHQFRIGIESTRVCECGQGIDDINHFLLHCTMYESLRRELKVEVKKFGKIAERMTGSTFLYLCYWLPSAITYYQFRTAIEYFWQHSDILKNHNVNCNLPSCMIAAHRDWSTVDIP